MTWLPSPKIPSWAESAGCPSPREKETFEEYVVRLGLDFDELVSDLTAATAEIANLRLAAELRNTHPQAFDGYLARRIEEANPKNDV